MLADYSLIDSHCHIVFESFKDDLDLVADRWRSAGVKSLLHACVEPSEIPAIKSLADRFPEMRYAVGLHPLDTDKWNSNTLKKLRNAAIQDSRVVAVGELGLDLFRDDNLQEQLAVLKPQLQLAYELDLPVIIHCRDAASEMTNLLNSLKTTNCCPKGVMHCWSGTVSEMRNFLELGFYISFSGNVTFPKAKEIHDCARHVPQDRFLVETDCPFLSPVPLRGKRNEPGNVKIVAQKVADLRGEPFNVVANQTTSNAMRLFGLP